MSKEIKCFADLKGEILKGCERKGSKDGDLLVFTLEDGREFALFHEQECCESVRIEDVCGDLSDLVGTPLLLVEEVSNSTDEPPESYCEQDCYTWTFYKLSTIKGSVTIRWFGESNGCYSEGADFGEIENGRVKNEQ